MPRYRQETMHRGRRYAQLDGKDARRGEAGHGRLYG